MFFYVYFVCLVVYDVEFFLILAHATHSGTVGGGMHLYML